jgi:hypothetical protein
MCFGALLHQSLQSVLPFVRMGNQEKVGDITFGAMCFGALSGTISRYSHYYCLCERVTKKRSVIPRMEYQDRRWDTQIEDGPPKIEAQKYESKSLSASLIIYHCKSEWSMVV